MYEEPNDYNEIDEYPEFNESNNLDDNISLKASKYANYDYEVNLYDLNEIKIDSYKLMNADTPRDLILKYLKDQGKPDNPKLKIKLGNVLLKNDISLSAQKVKSEDDLYLVLLEDDAFNDEITIKLRDGSNIIDEFKVKLSQTLLDFTKKYADERGIIMQPKAYFSIIFNGKTLKNDLNKTFSDVNIGDGDIIDFRVVTPGGNY